MCAGECVSGEQAKKIYFSACICVCMQKKFLSATENCIGTVKDLIPDALEFIGKRICTDNCTTDNGTDKTTKVLIIIPLSRTTILQ